MPARPSVRSLSTSARPLLPGLIDAHVHLAFQPDADDPVSDLVEVADEVLLERMHANAARALAAGITPVRDLGDRRFLTGRLRERYHGGVVGPEVLWSILTLYRRLLAVRRAHPALSIGDITLLDAEGDVLAYERRYGAQRLIVALISPDDRITWRCRTGRVIFKPLLSTVAGPAPLGDGPSCYGRTRA